MHYLDEKAAAADKTDEDAAPVLCFLPSRSAGLSLPQSFPKMIAS